MARSNRNNSIRNKRNSTGRPRSAVPARRVREDDVYALALRLKIDAILGRNHSFMRRLRKALDSYL